MSFISRVLWVLFRRNDLDLIFCPAGEVCYFCVRKLPVTKKRFSLRHDGLVYGQVGNQADNQVDDQVVNQVVNQTDNQVDDQLDDQLDD